MTVDLVSAMEAEDGIVEVGRVLAHLDMPWMALPPGPRRWAPADLSVEVEQDVLQVVRMTYRTVGNRAVVVAACRPGVEIDWLAEQLATPLLFAHYRRAQATMAPGAIMAAIQGEPVWDDQTTWDDEPRGEGWQFGLAGFGSRPVRLACTRGENGSILMAAHGLAEEEATTVVSSLVPLTSDCELATDLHVRHRRGLAQRWWDAPRAPWDPDEH